MFTQIMRNISHNTPHPPSFRESVLSRTRKTDIAAFISELATNLPQERLLVTSKVNAVRIESGQITLKSGDLYPLNEVKFIMLRLELLKAISPDTFSALVNYVKHGENISDWHAINAECYGLGETKDSDQFANLRIARRRSAFLRGMCIFAPISRCKINYTNIGGDKYLEFKVSRTAKAVIMSAISPNGEILSPER